MPAATESQIKLTSQLYEMRDRAKRLCGANYATHMKNLGKILTDTASRDKKTVLQVAIEASKRNGTEPINVMLVLAAAVELTEPST